MSRKDLIPGHRPGRGRPKGFKGVAKMIMKETKDGRELVDFALKTFRDEEALWHMRWAAHQWLADRALGKPMQTIELAAALEADEANQVGTGVNVDLLSEEQARALRAILLAASGKANDGAGAHNLKAYPHALSDERCVRCQVEQAKEAAGEPVLRLVNGGDDE